MALGVKDVSFLGKSYESSSQASGPLKQSLLGIDTIAQPEDLYTVRPRYYNSISRGERGVRATFTIISFLKDQQQITPANQATQKLRERLLPNTTSRPYADFLVTGLQFSFQEKIQLQPVFGDHTVAYAFGAAPVVLNIAGVLTDDIDNDWFYNYLVLYRDYLRGTQLARNFELCQLSMHNADYLGIIMGVSFSQDASNDALIQFQMQFLVREYLPYSAQQVRAEDVKDDTIEKLQASIGRNDKGLFKVPSSPADILNKAKAAKEKFGNIASSVNDMLDNVIGVSGCNSTETVSKADDMAVLKVNVGGIVGLGQLLDSFGRFNSNDAGKATWLENKLGKIGCSSAGTKTLSVIGAYGNTVQKLNKGISSFGDTLTTVQRNLEVFNRVVGHLTNPVPELLDTLANIRQQVNKVTELANMVKKSYQDLKNIKNSFDSFSSEWDQLKKDFGNMKGAFSSFNESSADRLRGSFKNNSASLPAALGNARLGITKEQAMAKLNAIGNQTTAEKFVLPSSSSSYTNNADQKAALNF